MNKNKLLLAAAAITFMAVAAVAASHTGVPSKKSANKAEQIYLYQQDNKQSEHKTFNLSRWHYARPFYRKHKWLKVAFTDNGDTGWVNTNQLETAFVKAEQADTNIQTVYVNRTTGGNGKPVVNIVAYKNGKKLTDTQAENLYQKMRVNGLKQQEYFNRMNMRLQNIMNHDFDMHDPLFNVSYSHDFDNWHWPNF